MSDPERNRTRIEMHSPPKKEKDGMSKLESDNYTIIIVVSIICLAIAICVLGGLYIVYHH